MGASLEHRRQLKNAPIGQIWDHLNTKIIKDYNELYSIENIELMSPNKQYTDKHISGKERGLLLIIEC